MPHLLCVVTNKIHQNGDFSQFFSHALSAQVNDFINRASTLRFSNFRDSGPKIPKITLKIVSLNVRTGKQVHMQ